MLRIAQQNLHKMRITNVDLHQASAEAFESLDEYNYLYLYNPFPCVVMDSVMRSLVASLDRKPRRFRIIYLNPVCSETILGSGHFVKIKEFRASRPRPLPFFVYESMPGKR